MGVQGLTTYVKTVQRSVSEEVNISVPADTPGIAAGTASSTGPLVIDGWAWIYRAYLDHLQDVIRGGDYVGYTLYVRQVVAALRKARLEPIFLFDGPYLPLKVPTVLSRMEEVASNNSAFMRSTYRSRHSAQTMASLPTLLYDCTLEALRQCKVHIEITECEADSAVAETAERLGGWAVSNDSDFFILCSRGSNCKGYVPIDSIHYVVSPPLSTADDMGAGLASSTAEEDDGFAPVGKKGKAQTKRPKVVQERPEVTLYHPPATEQDGTLLAVRFTAYSSIKLAQVLEIPTTMLPLLAALIGNDYTAAVQRRILSPALPHAPDRIPFIASAIRQESTRAASVGSRTPAPGRSGAATPSAAAARTGLGRAALAFSLGRQGSFGSASAVTSATATPTGPVPQPTLDEALAKLALSDPVRFMVHNVVDRILASSPAAGGANYVSSAEKDEVVDAVIDTVFTYSLLTNSSAPHLASPSAAFFKPSTTQPVLTRYQRAYSDGFFDRMLVEAATQRIFLARVAPEDPDQKSTQTTHARDLRRWLHTTLFSGWGMGWARETLEEPEPEPEMFDDGFEEDEDQGIGRVPGAIPILAGPGPNRVDWEREGDPDELIPVQTPPSSFGSSMNGFSSSIDDDDDDDDEEDEDDDDDDEVRSQPASVVQDALTDPHTQEAGIKPPPAVTEYARKGERYAPELCPILSLDTLVTVYRDELGIEPPESLARLLR
ncbi:PIN domain-like protein [Testicularia cyperi]|uniref:PIN domain-like protein n=1 Tax=Testicularia cyperi TaxID=1882483 RepID=A0A317XQ87_9BASI|nr:PIN domain-like protein [Testicularia cyperi]